MTRLNVPTTPFYFSGIGRTLEKVITLEIAVSYCYAYYNTLRLTIIDWIQQTLFILLE
jgi:hypothetical protein